MVGICRRIKVSRLLTCDYYSYFYFVRFYDKLGRLTHGDTDSVSDTDSVIDSVKWLKMLPFHKLVLFLIVITKRGMQA